MAKLVRCPCGQIIRGKDDDELVQNVQKLAHDVHGGMAITREQALAMAEPDPQGTTGGDSDREGPDHPAEASPRRARSRGWLSRDLLTSGDVRDGQATLRKEVPERVLERWRGYLRSRPDAHHTDDVMRELRAE